MCRSGARIAGEKTQPILTFANNAGASLSCFVRPTTHPSALARLCRKCGTNLRANLMGSEAIADRASSGPGIRLLAEETATDVADGERKTVTVVFADIKGSTELMRELDPEEARTILDPILQLMMTAVHRYDGYVAQSTGDGIFAMFGAPVAHEDHPQCALYAPLRLQEQLRRYSNQRRTQGRSPLQARAGINTGEVVVRSIHTSEGHTEYTSIGHSTGLASRIRTLAPVGSNAAADTTRKLCEGYFRFKSLGPTLVKAVSSPINIYEVTVSGRSAPGFSVGRGRPICRASPRWMRSSSSRARPERARSDRRCHGRPWCGQVAANL
jgi:class 3 adenylate cyclase